MTNRNYVDPAQEVWYISQTRKILVGRNNQPITQKLKLDYSITDRFNFSVINSINQIVNLGGYQYQAYVSWTNARKNRILLVYQGNYSITDNVITFVLDSYTQPYLDNITNNNGQECDIVISRKNNRYTEVVLRDKITCYPRSVIEGVTPITFVTQTVFDGAIPVSGSFGAGQGISLVPGETNSFAFGTDLITANDNQFVIGEKNNQDATKLFIAANSGNVFTVDYEGNVEANTISASNLFVNGEEFSLSGIDEKFEATSGWVNETFETKVDATNAYNSLENSIEEVDGKFSGYATKQELPTKVSDLTNDSGFATTGYVDQQMSGLLITVDAAYENKTAAGQKFDYLSTQISNTNENIYQNYALKSEVPTRVSQLTNDEDFASKTYVGEKDQEVLGYVGNNYTTNATFNSSITNLTNSIGSVNSNLTANYALKTSVPTAVSQLTNDTGYITGVNLDPYALKTEIPTKVSELDNDAEYITSADIPTVLKLSNKKTALIDRDVKEYNFRISYKEDVEVFVNWQQTLSGVLYLSPIQHFELEEGKQVEVQQFVKPVGEFTAVSGNGIEVLNLPQTFGEDKILVFKRFITNDNGVIKQFAKFEFEYSNEDVEQLIHEPLTFIALEDDTKIACDIITGSSYNPAEFNLALQYSINEGEWQDYTYDTEITLNQGEELSFKRLSGDTKSSSYYAVHFKSSQGKFIVEGSVGSITTINNANQMFRECTNLVDASKLELHNSLSGIAYNYVNMFANCTSLTAIPKLPVTTLAQNCYNNMFYGCTSLTEVPEDLLPATTLAIACYYSMFGRCISLKNVPRLPATTLANSCYYNMFKDCTSLTEVPEDLLPATTLAQDCYNTMFANCTILRKAPKLPATTLVGNGCYQYMFNGCNSLEEIDVAFTSWGTDNKQYTNSWLVGVNSIGVFKKTTSLPVIRSGHNIPSGWLVENEDDLNFIAHGSVQIELKQTGNPDAIDLHYSTDGETFQVYNIGDVIILSAGQVLSMYNTTSNFSKDAQGSGNYYNFSMSGTGWVEVEGHIDALVNHTNGSAYKYFNLFKDCTRIFDTSKLNMESDTSTFAAYCQMFASCTGLLYGPKLPSTVADYCYQAAFKGCTSLTQAPELPATTLRQNCYQGMFNGCTSLTVLPKLPATTLSPWCYAGMFQNCTSLTGIPENYLPATTLAANCYNQMFEGCTKIKDLPEGLLPVTTLVGSDYYRMFKGCTSLTGVPKNLLPATVMKTVAYAYMFQDCTSLSTAPDINIIEIQAGNQNAFYGMFKGCTSLQKAPDLHAKTLVNGCYSSMFENCRSLTDTGYIAATGLVTDCCPNMFKGCSNLSSINVGFAEWNDIDNATYNWVNGVAQSGIFRKPASLNRVEGPSNIPANWKKIDNDCVTFICKEDDVEVALIQVGTPSAITMLYSVNGNDLEPYSVGSVVSLQPGDTVSFKGTTETFGKDSQNRYTFTTTGNGFVEVEGPINSLINGNTGERIMQSLFVGNTRLTDASRLDVGTTANTWCYNNLFYNCSSLTAVPKLPATTVGQNSYSNMFYGCTSLSTVPEDLLPATTLGQSCYNGMFQKCSNLTNVPRLPATVMKTSCYGNMFHSCSGLVSVPEDLLPATTLAYSCYYSMFMYAFALTNVPRLPATVLPPNCYQNIFYNCISLSTVPEDLLPATTIARGCYYNMFFNCTHLTNAPALPATEMGIESYYDMFYGCTSLSTAPQLPATKLAAGCYAYMFRGTKITSINLPAKLLVSNCYKQMFIFADRLSSVTVGFTNWDEDENCTSSWLSGVAANGVFYCPSNLDTTTRDDSHVPAGWSINPANTRGGESKGGSKKKGGDIIPDIPEQEEIIEEQIPPYDKQERTSQFPEDENSDHLTGKVLGPFEPDPIEEDGEGEEEPKEKEDLPKEELRK